MSLERLHRRLRLDLGQFAPWMAQERIRLVIYRDQKEYLQGKYAPPRWSNGISLYPERTVVVYDQKDRKKLLQVISHETSHLIFESFWADGKATPPSWINEGLAMLQESESSDRAESSDWYRLMADLPRRAFPLAEFVKISPNEDLAEANEESVATWYIQAHSTIYFLSRKHNRLQFKDFCSRLKEGRELRESLWLAYRFQSLSDLEGCWKSWLRSESRRLP